MRPAKHKSPELEFQKTVKEFLNLSLPKNVFWTAFPAGGGGAAHGARMKAGGLVSGVPDVLVIFEGQAIFLELKAKNNSLTHSQKITIPRLIEAGATVHLCRSVEDVAHDLTECGIPLKYKLGQWTARNTQLRAA